MIGPFALPLVWGNPRFKLATKVTITVLVLALTLLILYLLGVLDAWFMRRMGELMAQ